MARKQKNKEVKHAIPTRRQLSKWQQQQRLQRIIFIAGGIFLVIILAFVGYGYYDAQIKPLHQKVLSVNDTTFDMKYYLEWLAVSLPGIPTAQRNMMADIVISYIMRNELMIQNASSLGVTVDESEIDEGLAEQKMPNNRMIRDEFKAQLLGERLMATYFDSKVPVSAEQIKINAMFLESQKVAADVISRLSGSESFTELAKGFSKETFTKEKSGDMGWILKDTPYVADGKFIGSKLWEIASSANVASLSIPTYDPTVKKTGGYWLLKVVEIDAEANRQVRGILLGTPDEAEELRKELSAGADFEALAKEKSQHPGSKDFGGDLGWIQKGSDNLVIANASFALDIGVVSDPVYDDSVTTSGGYWLIKVLEKEENRAIESETREQIKGKEFQDWLEKLRESSTIVQYLTNEQKEWAVRYTENKLGLK